MAVGSERSGPVTTIVLDRPEARNAVDRATAEALAAAFRAFEQEGYSPNSLTIGGRRRDHERWAIGAEMWRARRAGAP